MRANVKVDTGVCGFHSKVEASCEDGMFVVFEIESDCDKIQALAEALGTKGPINLKTAVELEVHCASHGSYGNYGSDGIHPEGDCPYCP